MKNNSKTSFNGGVRKLQMRENGGSVKVKKREREREREREVGVNCERRKEKKNC